MNRRNALKAAIAGIAAACGIKRAPVNAAEVLEKYWKVRYIPEDPPFTVAHWEVHVSDDFRKSRIEDLAAEEMQIAEQHGGKACVLTWEPDGAPVPNGTWWRQPCRCTGYSCDGIHHRMSPELEQWHTDKANARHATGTEDHSDL